MIYYKKAPLVIGALYLNLIFPPHITQISRFDVFFRYVMVMGYE